jgi:hypothetical protein
MYELDPPQEWFDYQSDHPPRQKIDSNGKLMWELHPRPGKPRRALLDFPHLKKIDKVSWKGTTSQNHANILRFVPTRAGYGGR